MPEPVELKRAAAQQALAEVHDDMVLGLGTGTTMAFFLEGLGARLRSGELQRIRGVPTSDACLWQAQVAGVPLTTLAETPELDLAIDGADEVDPDLNLIKGLGKALLREKIVVVHARRFLVVADESKLSPRLGLQSPLPVEILPFAAEATVRWLQSLGCRAALWLDAEGAPIRTDNGNYLARCWFDHGIPSPQQLQRLLADRPGVLEHGLFLGMASAVIVAGAAGVSILERE